MTEQQKAQAAEHPQLDESTGFDYRTHISDSRTGKLVRLQHYTRHARGTEVLLERPPGSGNCFNENGTPAGRYSFVTKGRETMWEKVSDEHIATKPAPANHMEELTQRNEALEQELAALRAEAQKPQQTVQKK